MPIHKKDFNITTVIRTLVLILICLTIVATIFLVFAPLFPTEKEYIGSFPENFKENLDLWVSKYLPRHLMLFNIYYDIVWILSFLSNVFFLILLVNVRKAVDKIPEESGAVVNDYFNWAISSLLIAVVFLTKYLNEENIQGMSLGILGLIVSIFLLLYYKKKMV